jgi:hypothetical protein
MGSYRDILGQNHTILLKNRQILEKMYNHFIFNSILNLSEYSYDKMSWVVISDVPNMVVNISLLNDQYPCLPKRVIVMVHTILKALEKCYKVNHVCTLAHGTLRSYFGAKS